MTTNDSVTRIIEAMRAARLDPEVEAGRKPPTDDFHSSIGLWQQAPGTWEEV